MSRVAKAPISVPAGVEVKIDGQTVSAKGPKGSSAYIVHEKVQIIAENGLLRVAVRESDKATVALAGTWRMLIANLLMGVKDGFQRKLEINGVGYRAQVQGRMLNLTLGFSHPVAYPIPEGITIETPTQTEILVKGIDKQRVGQTAADIRAYRPPEPYKGKGIKYSDEVIVRKEAKKA
jgi:large subunit ribosomal protein L6